jgi:WD40 repeat protein
VFLKSCCSLERVYLKYFFGIYCGGFMKIIMRICSIVLCAHFFAGALQAGKFGFKKATSSASVETASSASFESSALGQPVLVALSQNKEHQARAYDNGLVEVSSEHLAGLYRVQSSGGPVVALALNNQRTCLAVTTSLIDKSYRISVWVFGASGGNLLYTFTYTDPIVFVELCSDGQHFLTVSEQGETHVWDTHVRIPLHELQTLSEDGQRVVSALFSLSGSHVVTLSENGTLRLWHILTANSKQTLSGISKWSYTPEQESAIVAYTFSHDEQAVVIVDSSGLRQVLSLDYQPKSWVDEQSQRSSRSTGSEGHSSRAIAHPSHSQRGPSTTRGIPLRKAKSDSSLARP